jgi:hypothetical protein
VGSSVHTRTPKAVPKTSMSSHWEKWSRKLESVINIKKKTGE